MTNSSVLILGAKSDIGRAIAYKFAKEGFTVRLAGRNRSELSRLKKDIEIRHQVAVSAHEFDVVNTKAHLSFVKRLPELPEVVVCVIGLLGDQQDSETNYASADLIFDSNFVGPSHILSVFANQFETRGSGSLIGISSVAGDRGRASNYVYGSAKAGFSAFLSGLRNRMASKGVQVTTVLPGFVYTKMTADMDLPGALTATPEEVGDGVFKAWQAKRDVIYVRAIWRWIMLIIKLIPETIFKRLSL